MRPSRLVHACYMIRKCQPCLLSGDVHLLLQARVGAPPDVWCQLLDALTGTNTSGDDEESEASSWETCEESDG